MDKTKEGRWVRFMPQEPYVKSFKDRGAPVPPFIVMQPLVIRDGVEGYLVPSRDDHPDKEWYVDDWIKGGNDE